MIRHTLVSNTSKACLFCCKRWHYLPVRRSSPDVAVAPVVSHHLLSRCGHFFGTTLNGLAMHWEGWHLHRLRQKLLQLVRWDVACEEWLVSIVPAHELPQRCSLQVQAWMPSEADRLAALAGVLSDLHDFFHNEAPLFSSSLMIMVCRITPDCAYQHGSLYAASAVPVWRCPGAAAAAAGGVHA